MSSTNEAQQRIMKIVEMLANDVVMGYSPMQIARHIGTSPANITRDMSNLEQFGWVERDEERSTWRLTPRFGQQSFKVQNSIERAARRVEETQQRYTRIS